ncbi:(Fe-S)-binding protein [Acidianus manzaensis]|uniref:Fe-S oxidoreductase n=1 Tax=Acidianus manzaensis TaxID=282676 RepID=A0A1W6JYJ1_9CREN|nr:(Fe-S)-binding protein [Acidianus manzaensis]ARM75333.1 Fe-S oxidoreductase [Acidianus manzaensis]
MAERKNDFCGGFKVEKGGKIQIKRQLVSRVFDEMSPADVWGVQECMRCGVCRFACPFWLVTEKSTDIPAWRTYEINKMFSMFYSGYGIVARYLRLRRISSKELKQWRESAYNCTACGACTDISPLEIPNWYTALLLRRILHYSGTNLPEVESWIENTKKVGNALGIEKEKWNEIAKDLPTNINAEILYVPSALEVNRDTITEIDTIMSNMHEKWTVSSEIYDIGYYAYFAGDFETARSQFMKIYEEAKKLGVKKIVTSDGAGFFFLRWQGPKSLRYKLDIKVEHLSETVYEEYKAGKIKIEKADLKDDITVHDSEFMSRLGGLEKPPREILRLSIPNFKEPKPSPSSHNLFTCGHHLELIKEKADIIKDMRKYASSQLSTWAKSVVTLDPNCKLSMDNAIRDSQGLDKSYYYTTILSKAIKS